jgi:hypothetical protein
LPLIKFRVVVQEDKRNKCHEGDKHREKGRRSEGQATTIIH